MYQKRLSGYASNGYPAKAESVAHEPAEMIVDNTSFLPVCLNDMMNAAREMMIVSPFVTRRRALQMPSAMKPTLEKKVSVAVVTRPPNNYRDKDRPTLEKPLASLQSSRAALCFQTQHSSKGCHA